MRQGWLGLMLFIICHEIDLMLSTSNYIVNWIGGLGEYKVKTKYRLHLNL